MTTENDIIEFLRSRLDEDETAALRATPPGVWMVEPDGTGAWTVVDEDAGETVTRDAAHYTAHHIAHHSPDRALREVAAKRQLLRWVMNWPMRPAPPSSVDGVLEMLALPYSDHPDYREEWTP